MRHLTPADLKQILDECAGEDEEVVLDEPALDTPFSDLGYDSLALLEAAAAAGRRFGVRLTDDAVSAVGTPREFLSLVNDAIVTAA